MEQLTPANRCEWAKHPLEITYHDTEWGIAVYDDRKLFEFLLLDSFQAGLSWLTMLKKREHFRKVFDNFDFTRIAQYSEEKKDELHNDKGIIRNKKKIEAAVNNAEATLNIVENHGSLSNFLWKFVDFKPIINHYKSWNEIPATTKISDEMSKALKKEGFSFAGSTICYAFMQAAGMVNDHIASCPRHHEVQKSYRDLR